ncbi:hypothetical protein SK128_005279 [Halocaridina rubra]|uniref:Uncharacterized protein n=1 Tax=Halocaridina rubra TaxID=373956 RepID=A0AAN8WI69_HALRR
MNYCMNTLEPKMLKERTPVDVFIDVRTYDRRSLPTYSVDDHSRVKVLGSCRSPLSPRSQEKQSMYISFWRINAV